MQNLEIIIKPTFDSTRDSMDYSEDDDFDSDAVLFQQGYDMDFMDVEPGDSFTINEGYTGEIDSSEVNYKLISPKDKFNEFLDDEEDERGPGTLLELKPGTYILLDDGIRIKRIK